MKQEIRKFYFGNSTINDENLPQLINMMSDSVFGLGIDNSVRKHAVASKGNTFYYR